MQRILHIVGKMDRAGAETMIMNLYRAIDRTQIQFDFVVFSEKSGDFDEEIISLGGKIYIINKKNPITRMFALRRLLIKHPEYKILHGHTLLSNAFHIIAAKTANVPHRLVHAHSTSNTGGHMNNLYQHFSKIVISRLGTKYMACGKEAANFLFPRKKNVSIIPNSIPTAHYSIIGDSHKNFLDVEFNLNPFCLKIVQIGRLQKVKNHKFSIGLATELKKRGISFKMFFVGQGALNNDIKLWIQDADVENEVLLLGLRADIPQIMAGADVMIMPSIHEGFPVVLVEAQSIGLPSLISDSISEEVDLNVELVEFESLDSTPDIWIERLLEIKNKPKIQKDVRLDKLAKQGFDIHSNVEKLTKLYKSLKHDV